MLSQFFFNNHLLTGCFLGTLIALAASFAALKYLTFLIPEDHGRAFAVEGVKSRGKPTGAGLLFITVFAVTSFLFIPMRPDYIVYLLLIEAAMLFGFLDDGAKSPWNEYLKGALDLGISFLTALTYACFSSRTLIFPILGFSYKMDFALYVILATVLVWAAINVTNCTDGVDGLSSSLAIISMISMLFLSVMLGSVSPWTGTIFIMIAVLSAYLWFNTNPSMLLMGDAGSRAIGVFLAVSIMHTRQPLAYLFLCLVFILDGGAGIVKISLKRFLHISILKNTTTPFHDHLRKKIGWSNPQTTVRMSLIHALICIIYLALAFIRINW